MSNAQLSLFSLEPTVQPKYAKGATIEQRFKSFDKANPHVYETLKRISLDMKCRGVTKWSIKAAYEILRWMAAMQTVGENFKLSNDFHALYARKLMAEEPQLDGFFECRARREKHQ